MPSLCCLPGAGPHCASISREVGFAADDGRRRGTRAWTLASAPIARCVALEDRSRERIDVGGHIDRIALARQGGRALREAIRTPRGMCGRAGRAGIGREVEQHDRDACVRHRSARRSVDQLGAPCAASASARSGHDLHLARQARRGEGAARVRNRCRVRPTRRTGRRTRSARSPPSSSGIATIIVDSSGSSPCRLAPHGLQRLEFDRVRRDIWHVELREHRLGGCGVVIGGAADQAEAGQRHHRIDRRHDRRFMKSSSIAGRASSPLAKAGMTSSPRASSAAITPS